MLQTWRSRLHLPGRSALVVGSALIVILVVSLVAEIITLPHRPVFQHTPNAPNQGASLLLLGSPNDNPYNTYITRLTMTRTSDGAVLWQYDLPGVLATGQIAQEGALLDGTAIQIVNGAVYFAVDPMPLGNPNRMQSLVALRASDGTPLWQAQIQGSFLEIIGVSDGVVCVEAGLPHPQGNDMLLAGYDAKTGARVWQRSSSDVIGSMGFTYPILIDGVLYLAGSSGSSSTGQRSATTYALQASTGQTLWQYTQSGPTLTGPIIGAQGVAVFYSITGDLLKNPATTLVGIQESDGTVLWRYALSAPVQNIPTGGSGIMESNGVAYFVTATQAPELNALRLQDGTLLWQQPVTAEASVMWYISLAAGSIYVATADPYQGFHPSFDNPSIAAFQASSGALRWRYQPAEAGFPEVVADANAATVLGNDTLYGVRASDGAALWQQTIASRPAVLSADGSLIVWYAMTTDIRAGTGASHLCALEPESGAQSWCQDIDGWLYAVLQGP